MFRDKMAQLRVGQYLQTSLTTGWFLTISVGVLGGVDNIEGNFFLLDNVSSVITYLLFYV